MTSALQRRIDDAIVIEPKNSGEVAIGSTVTIEIDGSDRRQTFTIVGEDQANPAEGNISWTSPLGRALVGARLGAKLTWERPIGDVEVVITALA